MKKFECKTKIYKYNAESIPRKLDMHHGIYFLLDKNKHVIRIGQSVSLRNRVLSYNNDIRISPDIIKYVAFIFGKKLNILEKKYITLYKPQYNYCCNRKFFKPKLIYCMVCHVYHASKHVCIKLKKHQKYQARINEQTNLAAAEYVLKNWNRDKLNDD